MLRFLKMNKKPCRREIPLAHPHSDLWNHQAGRKQCFYIIHIWRQKKENATRKSTTAINQSIDKSTTKQEQQKQNSLVNTVPGSCDPVLIDKSSPTPVSWGETKEGGSSHRNLEKWEEWVKNIFATDVWMKSYKNLPQELFYYLPWELAIASPRAVDDPPFAAVEHHSWLRRKLWF